MCEASEWTAVEDNNGGFGVSGRWGRREGSGCANSDADKEVGAVTDDMETLQMDVTCLDEIIVTNLIDWTGELRI